MEKAQAVQMLARSIIGSPEAARTGIDTLIAKTEAYELMIVSDVYDHATRLPSFELIAGVGNAGAGIERVGIPGNPTSFRSDGINPWRVI